MAKRRYRLQPNADSNGAVTFKEQPRPQVLLATFDFEQTVTGVRVVDADGSIYSGQWEGRDMEERLVERQTADKFAADLQKQKDQLADPAQKVERGDSVPADAYLGRKFRVIGTNRTSGQRIVFEGSFAPLNPTTSLGSAGGRGASPAMTPAISQQHQMTRTAGLPPQPAASDRLLGRVRIGSTNELPIVAVPANR